VLLVDREPVSDSTRILQRIDRLTGAFTRDLDERQRAEAWLWEELSDTALNGFVVNARWAFDENWPLVLETYFGTAPWFVKKLIAPRLRKYVVGNLIARDVWRQGRDACWARFLENARPARRARPRGWVLGECDDLGRGPRALRSAAELPNTSHARALAAAGAARAANGVPRPRGRCDPTAAQRRAAQVARARKRERGVSARP